MKIKNNLIIALFQAGCLNIAANTEDANHAYSIIKFRRGLAKAFTALQEAEKGLVDECGLTISENGKIDGKKDDLEKFTKLRAALYGDESDIELGNPIPYAVWHELKKSYKGLSDPYIEDSLEGVFWVAPAE